ncbi:MAG: GIY-YIG nuclease family protein [Cytophagales bacterium]
MKQFVYILKCADNSIYVGCTNNLKRRIESHLQRKVKSTSYRTPVKLITHIVFEDKYKAYFFEKYLKSGSGRAFLNKRLI